MKKGNQFYLETQIYDEDDNLLNINSVKKVQFNIGSLTKTYDKINNEVTYDENEQKFMIWLNEDETFNFDLIKIDGRVLFKNDIILGTEIQTTRFNEVVNEVKLDVKNENN